MLFLILIFACSCTKLIFEFRIAIQQSFDSMISEDIGFYHSCFIKTYEVDQNMNLFLIDLFCLPDFHP